MALIFVREKTLNNIAVIAIAGIDGPQQVTTHGDFTIIKVNDQIVSINVAQYQKYFAANEGVHELSAPQVKVLQQHIGEFDTAPFFVIAKVLARITHPKSDRLFVLKVMTDRELQIVTNTQNSTVGQMVVVARDGAVLPSGTPIARSKVMGTESEGMLCGAATLGLGDGDGAYLASGTAGKAFIL